MPHKCTRCENIFKDGAAIILDGCPKCGWNKFLYVREDKPSSEVKTEIKIEKPAATGEISPEASKFIMEVDEMLGTKEEPKTPELRTEQKPESAAKEIGERVESIRILSPGQYEVNLEALLERKEIVMALKEDGTYIVHLPSVFKKRKDH